jgi:hypothetical protein
VLVTLKGADTPPKQKGFRDAPHTLRYVALLV